MNFIFLKSFFLLIVEQVQFSNYWMPKDYKILVNFMLLI